MTNAIVLRSTVSLFHYAGKDKNIKSSIGIFLQWCVNNGYTWQSADLTQYREYAIERWQLPTAKKHVERVRNRYRELLTDNRLRDAVQAIMPEHSSPADVYAMTEELFTRIRNIVDDKRLTIVMPTLTAQVDSQFRWLSRDEVVSAIESIPATSLLGLRDRAMMALAYTYALRTVDMRGVTIQDMLETVGGVGGVQVPLGKGLRQRFVFWRPETDLMEYVRNWTSNAGFTDGLVIRKVTPHDKVVNAPINTDIVNARFNTYGFDFNPHDLRRSSIRVQYESTRDLAFVQQQLGHTKPEQTIIYLGLLRPQLNPSSMSHSPI